MKLPAVSVVIPTYNRASLVPRAVQSALTAAAPGDEVIVVDDGSTDNTEAVLAPYLDRIRYVRTSNRGAGPARNRGVAEARCPLVAFLDSDDEFLPHKLAVQRTVMHARPDVVMSFSDFVVRDRQNRDRHHFLVNWHGDTRSWTDILGPPIAYSSLGPPDEGGEDFFVHIGDLYPAMLAACYVPTFTVMVRREAAGDDIFAPEDLAFNEDWECFARLARRGPAAFLACETACNWGHDGPRLTQTNEALKATCRLTMLHRLWGSDPRFLATYCAEYERAVRVEHLRRARALLADGRTRDARPDLRRLGKSAPLAYRALSWLPGTVARSVFRLRR